jgi:hypothetical protein
LCFFNLCSTFSVKQKKSQMWWFMTIIPATQEAEAGWPWIWDRTSKVRKILSQNQSSNKRVTGTVQWYSIFLTCWRFWVQSPILHKNKTKYKFKKLPNRRRTHLPWSYTLILTCSPLFIIINTQVCQTVYQKILWRKSGAFSHSLVGRAFSRFLLLLNITWANWGTLEMQKEQRIDRQTESWVQVCWALRWRCTTFIASFLYYSLHFTLLLIAIFIL